MIIVANKRRGLEKIQKEFPNAIILDITSSSPYHYGQILSPFYPHRNIPIPKSKGMTATCVEAIWQGLKVFENSDIDVGLFSNDTMKGLKRTIRKNGKLRGHRYGDVILDYISARRYIYIPCYKYVLDNVPEVHDIVERIKKKSETSDIVLLDYNLNPDNRDITKPLSHAELVKMYIEERYPSKEEDFIPFTSEELKARKRGEKRRQHEKFKIETEEERKIALDKIIELLSVSELPSTRVAKVLAFDIKSKDLNKLIEGIPGIRIRLVKKTKYYSLQSLLF